MNHTPFGFRILGSCHEERRLVDHAGAFFGYTSCDARAQVEREAYLSAFMFGDEFRELLETTGSVKGFDGKCWSPWLWFDIDRADLEAALKDARRLSLWLVDRYGLDDDALLIFFSGGKGFHVGLPTSVWEPEPSATFNRVCRRFAERIAEVVGIVIDPAVYATVSPFRAPNSRHPKTGLHKRRLTLDELQGLSLDAVRKLAEKPAPFDLPASPPICEQARADWLAAVEQVSQESEGKATRNANGNGTATLNRWTMECLRGEVDSNQRAVHLYSSARNLAEFGCPPALAHALLTEPGLDSGLAPKEVHRQIECGLKDQGPLNIEQSLPPAPVVNAGDVQQQLAALWQTPVPTQVIEQVLADEPPPENRGDAWEHPLDRLGDGDGPYSKEGGRR